MGRGLRTPGRHRFLRLVIPGAAAALAIGVTGLAAAGAAAAQHHQQMASFNKPGDILIADQFNNRVVEINQHHRVVWQFGNGSNVPGPHSIVGTNDAERVGTLTLIAGTGTPPGADPSCLKMAGCPDNRVFLVNRAGRIVWQYGKAGVTGSGFNQLNTPVQATFLPGGNILITDQANERVIEVNKHHQIVWGSTARPAIVFAQGKIQVDGNGFNLLNAPYDAKVIGDYTGLTPPTGFNH